MWVLFLVIFYLAIGSIIGVIRSGSKGGSLREFLETIENYLEPPKTETPLPKPKEKIIKEEPRSVFYKPETSSLDEDDDGEEDIILQVERNVSKRNIKDVRALVNKRSIRHGIIVSEILNKPKSLRK